MHMYRSESSTKRGIWTHTIRISYTKTTMSHFAECESLNNVRRNNLNYRTWLLGMYLTGKKKKKATANY